MTLSCPKLSYADIFLGVVLVQINFCGISALCMMSSIYFRFDLKKKHHEDVRNASVVLLVYCIELTCFRSPNCKKYSH